MCNRQKQKTESSGGWHGFLQVGGECRGGLIAIIVGVAVSVNVAWVKKAKAQLADMTFAYAKDEDWIKDIHAFFFDENAECTEYSYTKYTHEDNESESEYKDDYKVKFKKGGVYLIGLSIYELEVYYDENDADTIKSLKDDTWKKEFVPVDVKLD